MVAILLCIFPNSSDSDLVYPVLLFLSINLGAKHLKASFSMKKKVVCALCRSQNDVVAVEKLEKTKTLINKEDPIILLFQGHEPLNPWLAVSPNL